MNEPGRLEVKHEGAWERYIRAEQQELKLRREGYLAKILDGPISGEVAG